MGGLPGCADNLSYNGAGLFWVALVGSRNADYERHASRPRFRQALTRVPHARIPHPLPWIRGASSDWGVIAVDTAFQGPDLSPIDAIAAAATTIGNVGPGLGVAGPVGTFEEFSDVSTVTMTILMWMGRLEVIPIAVLLTRRYWRV